MKIAFDAQALFEEEKTGIGWTVEKIINNLKISSSDEIQLNYFTFANRGPKKVLMERYLKKGYHLKKCTYFPLSIYRRIWNKVPLPYQWFMGRNADITQFFNYVVPPGVKGKKGVYIYDMVYRACPETMEETTRQYMELNVENSCRRADWIITISEFSKNEIVKYLKYPSEKIFVVPCGVDLTIYRSDLDEKKNSEIKEKFGITGSYYLYLGTLEPRKNIPLILTSYADLKKHSAVKIPKLVIAGKKGWGYQELFEKVKEYGLENDVIFTGYISEEEKPFLLKGAICFLFPSLYEGFGIPPLEAMACGTPVIVSNKASLPEVVGEAGLLVDSDDSAKMRSYMEQLLNDPIYRNKLGELCRSRAEAFSWTSAAAKLLEVYKNLV